MRPVRSAALISLSPRRKTLLERFVPEVRVLMPGTREAPVRVKGDVLDNARVKYNSVHVYGKADIVLAADTAVFLGTTVLGKPRSPEDASKMLHQLAGRWHEVTTGMVVFADGTRMEASVTTKVHFRRLEKEIIDAYVLTGEPLDKAGAYGIQGTGGLLVDAIEGDYFNVVGLPLFKLEELLESRGYALLG